jgi:hypothetical protein
MSVGEEVYEVTGLNKSTTCVCNVSTSYRDGEFCMPEDFNRDCGVQNNSSNVTHCIDAGCRFKQFNTPHSVPYFHVSLTKKYFSVFHLFIIFLLLLL